MIRRREFLTRAAGFFGLVASGKVIASSALEIQGTEKLKLITESWLPYEPGIQNVLVSDLKLHPETRPANRDRVDSFVDTMSQIYSSTKTWLCDPLVIRADGLIIDGRTRYEALKKLGAKSVDARVLGGPDSDLPSGILINLPISSLIIDNAFNFRDLRYKDTHLTDLALSIQEMGLMNPITITTKRKVISGFQRIEACKLLKHTTIACLVFDITDVGLMHMDLYHHEQVRHRNQTPGRYHTNPEAEMIL